ncbi:MAG: 2-oxoacid:acceptor oxidoreductase family protein, partial [Henriciella sp.]
MRPAFDPDRLPVPKIADLDQPWNVLLIGIGGTGITTVALILAMAAHIDGNAASSLDMTGLAQKGGPVLSHLRFARRPEQVRSGRIPPTEADCLIACDLVVAAGDDAIALSNPSRTRVCANRNVAPTSEFIHNRMARFDAGPLLQSLESEAASLADIEAEALAMHYFGDGVFTNMIMAGYAWQMGQVPVSLEALFAAIKLNGVRIDDNILAFNTGRMAAAMPDQLDTLSNPRSRTGKISLDELIADRIERLTAYQNEAYAQIFQRIVSRVKAAEAALGTGEKLTRQAAFQAYKLMA